MISALRDGVNPLTGEVMDGESIFQNSDVVRSLFEAADVLEKFQKRVIKQRNLPKNAGASWSSEEDRDLIANFEEGYSVEELAELQERTKNAIRLRLEKLQLLQYAD